MRNKFSNLAKVVYKRTYARKDTGVLEQWPETVERVIMGNVKGKNVSQKEIDRLRYFLSERKAGPAGRGWWYSGSPGHARLGGTALTNCWGLTADDWMNYVIAQDLLMLGGGVGMSVEAKYVGKLPRIKKDVKVIHLATKDAEFIVPDSREGWCELTRRVLEAFFETGRSFAYSTVCIRNSGDPIKGFGGVASGPGPVVVFIEKLCRLLTEREGKALRPIDAGDVLCLIAEMVVSGNVRRSALLLQGDSWDKEFLKAKRWDLGPIPSCRSNANYSVVAEDVDDLHPLFWATYEHGEAFGIVNLANIQKYGRMGEKKKDTARCVNPCVPAGTEILTSKGYLPIEELVGQSVDVWNGQQWSKVTPRITGRDQRLVRVELSTGQSLVCTPAHQWVLSTNYRGGIERKEAHELEIGDKLAKFAYPVIESGKHVEYAYTQGFISAEGMDGYSYLSVYDPKAMCIPRLHGHASTTHTNERRSFYPNFDPLPKNFVPFAWDLQSRLDWLAGLMDGDGTRANEGGVQIASVDRGFLQRIQKMLTTMGTASKLNLMSVAGLKPMPDGRGGTKLYPCQDCWRVLIGAQAVQALLQMGLKCERLNLVAEPNRDASRFPTVVSVEDAGTADVVYCFTEEKNHTGCFEGIVTGQCAEATLEDKEPCNLQDIALPNVTLPEFEEAARLMHRWGKRVTMESYHHEAVQEVIYRNRRIGTGITGCMQAPELFKPEVLDRVYAAIQDENVTSSKEYGIPQSIRTTVIKPSGTFSKLFDLQGEGLHAGFSRYMIQRIRFAAGDALIPKLREAGHYMEPVVKMDGTFDHGTLVVDFYIHCPDQLPCADEGFDTWQQLDTLLMAQKHWADQAVSVTVYYKRSEISQIKAWLALNLSKIKTISFLCHNDHGFKQAPKEAITKEQYESLSAGVQDLEIDASDGGGELLSSLECDGGVCPVR